MIIQSVKQPLLKEQILWDLAKATLQHVALNLDPDGPFRPGKDGEPSDAAKIILAHVVEHKPKALGIADSLILELKQELFSKEYGYFSTILGTTPMVTAMLMALMKQNQQLIAAINSLTSTTAEQVPSV